MVSSSGTSMTSFKLYQNQNKWLAISSQWPSLWQCGSGREYPQGENPTLSPSFIMGAWPAQVDSMILGSLKPHLRGMSHRYLDHRCRGCLAGGEGCRRICPTSNGGCTHDHGRQAARTQNRTQKGSGGTDRAGSTRQTKIQTKSTKGEQESSKQHGGRGGGEREEEAQETIKG